MPALLTLNLSGICSLSRNNFINFCNLHPASLLLITTDLTASCAQSRLASQVLSVKCPLPLPVRIRDPVGLKLVIVPGLGRKHGNFSLHSGQSDISRFPSSSSCLLVTSSFQGRLEWRGPNLLPNRRHRKGQTAIRLCKKIFESPLCIYQSEISRFCSPCMSVYRNHSSLVSQTFHLSLLCPHSITLCCAASCLISHNSQLLASS